MHKKTGEQRPEIKQAQEKRDNDHKKLAERVRKPGCSKCATKRRPHR